MIVVHASVLAPALADDGPDGDFARARLRGERLCAPSLVDLEAVSVLRRAVAIGRLDERRSAQALADLGCSRSSAWAMSRYSVAFGSCART